MRKYVLDLSEIYSDHRRKAYLGHRSTWTTIRSMIQTLREVFGIESHVHVCSAELIFYPDSESVEILRDGETLKILPVVASCETINNTGSEEDNSKVKETSIPQDSTIEDIEAFLCSLPKPKRRRVRKRKEKKRARENSPCVLHTNANDEKRDESEQENNPVSHRKKEKQARKTAPVELDERPYRNLNRQMKARVVRAVSLSTLSTLPSDEVVVSPPSELDGARANKNEQGSQNDALVTNSCKKARVVRAISLEDSVEVKREQIEASKEALSNVEPLQTSAPKGENMVDITASDEHEVSLIDEMETYSTIVSNV